MFVIPRFLIDPHSIPWLPSFPQGGGQLALLFGGQLPRGPKWLSFISQQRPEYIHQVQALEENFMALSTMIPSKCRLLDFFVYSLLNCVVVNQSTVFSTHSFGILCFVDF